MKYHTQITSWGEEALYFLEDSEMNFIILFNDGAPAELAEIAILHTPSSILAELEIGDTLIVGDKVFTMTAIGEEARHTFKELGHCTISFKGGAVAERPGCIMVEGDAPLTAKDIAEGTVIEIY